MRASEGARPLISISPVTTFKYFPFNSTTYLSDFPDFADFANFADSADFPDFDDYADCRNTPSQYHFKSSKRLLFENIAHVGSFSVFVL